MDRVWWNFCFVYIVRVGAKDYLEEGQCEEKWHSPKCKNALALSRHQTDPLTIFIFGGDNNNIS